jgi:hypothetical protein
MRLASRIIGVLLVIGGLGFFAILGYAIVTEGWRGAPVGLLAFFLAAGAGLLLGGRYYVDLDASEEVKPPSTDSIFRTENREAVCPRLRRLDGSVLRIPSID